MTDDQRDDARLLLASAYLDGEVNDEERARAEADPLVMAEVERLADVRRQLSAPVPVDAGRREDVLTAALAAHAPLAPPRPSLAARRRHRWLAPALGAAAAVVLVVGGVAILRNGSSSDDSSESLSARADQQADAAAELSADATRPPGQVEPGSATLPAAGQDQTAATEAAADAASAETTVEASEDTEAEGAVPTDGAVLRTPEDLLAFAAAGRSRPLSEFDATNCATDRFVGSATYAPAGAEARDVVVFVDDATGVVVALDPSTCAELARVAP